MPLHKSRKEKLFARLTVGIIFIMTGTLVAKADSRCREAALASSPRWVSSILAREESPRLIVVDPLQEKIIAYDDNGTPSVIPKPEMPGVSDFLPTRIDQGQEGSFFLELADSTVIKLNQKFLFLRTVLAPQAQKSPGLRLGSLYQWKIAGDDLIAYGALLDEGDNIIRGFFRVPLNARVQSPELLTQLDDSDYYLIGNSYITVIGSTAYYVAMNKSPAIFKVSPGKRPDKLNVFPEGFRVRPDFVTKMTGPRNAKEHFAELETFSVPSGLYSQDGFLYLLTRKPNSGKTIWSIYKIDPQRDENLSPAGIKLPTSVNHLSVAVGNDKWFLLQRGPVQEMQRQSISTVLVIDSSVILSSERTPDSCSSPATPDAKVAKGSPAPIPVGSSSGGRASSLGCISAIGGMFMMAVPLLIFTVRRRNR